MSPNQLIVLIVLGLMGINGEDMVDAGCGLFKESTDEKGLTTYNRSQTSDCSVMNRPCYNSSFNWLQTLIKNPTEALAFCDDTTFPSDTMVRDWLQNLTSRYLSDSRTQYYHGLCPCTSADKCKNNTDFNLTECEEPSNGGFDPILIIMTTTATTTTTKATTTASTKSTKTTTRISTTTPTTTSTRTTTPTTKSTTKTTSTATKTTATTATATTTPTKTTTKTTATLTTATTTPTKATTTTTTTTTTAATTSPTKATTTTTATTTAATTSPTKTTTTTTATTATTTPTKTTTTTTTTTTAATTSPTKATTTTTATTTAATTSPTKTTTTTTATTATTTPTKTTTTTTTATTTPTKTTTTTTTATATTATATPTKTTTPTATPVNTSPTKNTSATTSTQTTTTPKPTPTATTGTTSIITNSPATTPTATVKATTTAALFINTTLTTATKTPSTAETINSTTMTVPAGATATAEEKTIRGTIFTPATTTFLATTAPTASKASTVTIASAVAATSNQSTTTHATMETPAMTTAATTATLDIATSTTAATKTTIPAARTAMTSSLPTFVAMPTATTSTSTTVGARATGTDDTSSSAPFPSAIATAAVAPSITATTAVAARATMTSYSPTSVMQAVTTTPSATFGPTATGTGDTPAASPFPAFSIAFATTTATAKEDTIATTSADGDTVSQKDVANPSNTARMSTIAELSTGFSSPLSKTRQTETTTAASQPGRSLGVISSSTATSFFQSQLSGATGSKHYSMFKSGEMITTRESSSFVTAGTERSQTYRDSHDASVTEKSPQTLYLSGSRPTTSSQLGSFNSPKENSPIMSQEVTEEVMHKVTTNVKQPGKEYQLNNSVSSTKESFSSADAHSTIDTYQELNRSEQNKISSSVYVMEEQTESETTTTKLYTLGIDVDPDSTKMTSYTTRAESLEEVNTSDTFIGSSTSLEADSGTVTTRKTPTTKITPTHASTAYYNANDDSTAAFQPSTSIAEFSKESVWMPTTGPLVQSPTFGTTGTETPSASSRSIKSESGSPSTLLRAGALSDSRASRDSSLTKGTNSVPRLTLSEILLKSPSTTPPYPSKAESDSSSLIVQVQRTQMQKISSNKRATLSTFLKDTSSIKSSSDESSTRVLNEEKFPQTQPSFTLIPNTRTSFFSTSTSAQTTAEKTLPSSFEDGEVKKGSRTSVQIDKDSITSNNVLISSDSSLEFQSTSALKSALSKLRSSSSSAARSSSVVGSDTRIRGWGKKTSLSYSNFDLSEETELQTPPSKHFTDFTPSTRTVKDGVKNTAKSSAATFSHSLVGMETDYSSTTKEIAEETKATNYPNVTITPSSMLSLLPYTSYTKSLTSPYSPYPKYIMSTTKATVDASVTTVNTSSTYYGAWTLLQTVWNTVDYFFTPPSMSSPHQSAQTGSIGTGTIEYSKASKLFRTSTFIPDLSDQDPCSAGYTEISGFCYRILPLKDSTTYRRALLACHHADANLADESVLRNSQVLEFLRQKSLSTGANLYYVNDCDLKACRENKTVRIISLDGSTRFFLYVNRTAKTTERLVNVFALCKKGKFGDKVTCNLSDLELYGASQFLNISNIRMELDVGENISISCVHQKGAKVEIMCTEEGILHPHPTDLKCIQDYDKKVEEVETPTYQQVQNSCGRCYPLGTQSCVKVEGGFACKCKPEWTGFTCWKSANLCELTGLQCGPNGKCASSVDKTYCECDEFYVGEHCEYSKLSLSSYIYDKDTGIHGPSATALVLTTGDICLMVAKAALKLYRPKEGKDTQVFYQNMRSLFTSIGGLAILFFHHPGIFDISTATCGLWFFIITFCYSLEICFFALEALNVYDVIMAERRNVWGSALTATILPIHSISVRSSNVALFAVVVLIISAATQKGKITTSWSCVGHFSIETVDIWLLLILFNISLAVASTFFAYSGWVTLKYLPQYQQKMATILRDRTLHEENNTNKCYRNVIFVVVGPWLLLGTWLTTALSSDWIANRSVSILAVFFSMLYTATNLLQSIFTTPSTYSTLLQYSIRFLPRKLAPARDTVTLRKRSEVVQRRSDGSRREREQVQRRGYPWSASSQVARVLSWDLFSMDVRAYHLDANRATLVASKKKRIMTSTTSTYLNIIEKTESADIAVVETDANDTY